MINANATVIDNWIVTLKRGPKISVTERRERNEAQRKLLAEAGFKAEYRFPYHQKTNADAVVKQIMEKTGIEMTVGRCSLL